MTIIFFPSSRALSAVRVERELDGGAWFVITPRGHAWDHGSFEAALADARVVATGWGVVIKSSAEVFRP